MFFDEELPVVASFKNDTSEVSEVPCEDACIAGVSHSHHRELGEINARIRVLLTKVERQLQLRFGWSLKLVHSIEQRPSEDKRRGGMTTASQQQADFGNDRPREQHTTTKPAE